MQVVKAHILGDKPQVYVESNARKASGHAKYPIGMPDNPAPYGLRPTT
jgi:hypothetical protein